MAIFGIIKKALHGRLYLRLNVISRTNGTLSILQSQNQLNSHIMCIWLNNINAAPLHAV